MPKAKPDSESQSERFKATARELGADGDSSAADALLGRLAKLPRGLKPKPKQKAADKTDKPGQ